MKLCIKLLAIMAIMTSCTPWHNQSKLFKLFNGYHLNQDSLRVSINQACETWNRCVWRDEYKPEIFINHILPPQIADEPTEFYWRSDIPQWIDIAETGGNVLELAKEINSKIEIDTRHEDWGNAQMGYTATMSGRFGKCDDRAILTAMAMRAMGIPATFDLIPMWGSGNNGHSFCGVISPDESVLAFQNKRDNGTDVWFTHKVPKVYRRLFFENRESALYAMNNLEDIPELFNDFRLEDVTQRYPIGYQDVRLKSCEKSPNALCYLAVFNPSGWFPIAYGKSDGHEMTFQDIGNGYGSDGNTSLKGDDIGEGILYLPCFYNNGIIPASAPVIVSNKGLRFLKPQEEKEDVVLKRKYPRLARISTFAGYMTGGIIEIANNVDFSDAEVLHYIYDRPLSRLQKIAVSDKNFRYIRFRKPSGIFSIAELQVFDKDGKQIKGKGIMDASLSSVVNISNFYDNNTLSFFEISKGINLWVGIDLGKKQKVSEIAFCPRNDDNDISSGDTYELLYWNDQWISLGKQIAYGHELTYTNVPKGALLWLRDLTKGREERPFTYENGKQIWW